MLSNRELDCVLVTCSRFWLVKESFEVFFVGLMDAIGTAIVEI